MNIPVSNKAPENDGKGLVGGYGPYLSLGAQLAFGVVVFFFLGRYLDGKFATAPWLTILGSMLGITGGLIKFIRTAIKMGQQEDREHEEHVEKKST